MEDSYEYEYGYQTPPTSVDYDYPKPKLRTLEGTERMVLFLKVYFILPLVLILNLILFVKIVRTKKIKNEPWRWLIANTALCLAISSFLGGNIGISYLYQLPTLMSKPLCYVFQFVMEASWKMTPVSFTLVITERFHTLRLGVEDSAFTKKQVIICLACFWVILTIISALPPLIIPLIHGYPVFADHPSLICIMHSPMTNMMNLIIWIWAFPTFLVVFIGSLVLKGRKTTSDTMKQTIVNPTIALSCIGFVFMILPHTLLVSASMFSMISAAIYPIYYLINIGFFVSDIFFAIIWLATWSRNGDISLKCGGEPDDEQIRLLEKN